MSSPELWLRFVNEDDPGVRYPRLGRGPERSGREFELSDRARWVLAAIALPRALAPAVASDEAQRRRLGPVAWSSGEIIERIPYQHRSTIKHALEDLRAQLALDELVLEDYLEIDTRHGRYALRPGRVHVDVIALHAARDDPAEFDRLLAAEGSDPARAALAPICHELLQGSVHARLSEEILAAAERERRPPPLVPAPDRPRRPARSTAVWRRRQIWVPAVAVVVAALVVELARGSSTDRPHQPQPTHVEIAGAPAHTWSDPQTAGGTSGRPLRGGERVVIACRVRGFTVQDGDVWWYRLAAAPWSGRYYATADAFYNNGHTRGSLIGSALVDRRIAVCD